MSSSETQPTAKLSLNQYKEKYGDFQFTRVPYNPPAAPDNITGAEPPIPESPDPPQESGTLDTSQDSAPAHRDRLSTLSDILDSSEEETQVETTGNDRNQPPPLSADSSCHFGDSSTRSARPKATNLRVSTDCEFLL